MRNAVVSKFKGQNRKQIIYLVKIRNINKKTSIAFQQKKRICSKDMWGLRSIPQLIPKKPI